MTIKPLHLLFPQWQGSGPNNALFHAAHALADACPGIQFTPVQVPETESLDVVNGVLGYNGILSRMTVAADMVSREAPDVILTIGGDCGIEPVPVSWLNRKHDGNFTLVWLDAHADLNTPETSPSGCYHGMPLATLMGLGDPDICSTCASTLRPDQIILAGLRDLDPAEAYIIEKENITRVNASDMAADDTLLAEAILKKGNHPVYIHIDLDVLDPDAYPYVRHPEPGGLTPEALQRTLAAIRQDCTVAGLGLMEFSLEPYTRMSTGAGGLQGDRDEKGLETVIAILDGFGGILRTA